MIRDFADLYPSTRVYTPLPDPSTFDEAAVARFQREGFIAIENVFSAAELQTSKQALSDLVAGQCLECKPEFERGSNVEGLSADERERLVRKLMWFCKHEPRLEQMAAHPALLKIVKAILRSDVTMIQDMALLKPPHVGSEKPWHQDAAYFSMEPVEMILGTWSALDDATIENGCMHVIPGSHLSGPKPHYHDRDCQLPDDLVQVDQAVAVPLKPGGVLFFSGLLHHGTPPNRSPARRRALQFHYASVSCRRIEFSKHADYFRDSTGYAACAGWGTAMHPRPITDRAK